MNVSHVNYVHVMAVRFCEWMWIALLVGLVVIAVFAFIGKRSGLVDG